MVQVGHGRHKPAVDGLMQVHLRGIGVEYRRELVAGLQVGTLGRLRAVGIGGEAGHRVAAALLLAEPLGGVQPVLRGHVADPRVFESAMVEDHVHHHFQSVLMCVGDERAILLIGAEARVYAVVVGGGVAVVGAEAVVGVGRVVFQDRREPQGGDAELIEVVEVLADALEVAAVAQ